MAVDAGQHGVVRSVNNDKGKTAAEFVEKAGGIFAVGGGQRCRVTSAGRTSGEVVGLPLGVTNDGDDTVFAVFAVFAECIERVRCEAAKGGSVPLIDGQGCV